jgi:o-succinylbenzoate synthase
VTDAADGGVGWPRAVRLVRVRVPLRRPHSAAHGTESVRDVILVRWTRPDGACGWGECPTLSGPGYVTETTDEAWRALVGLLVPAAIAGHPPSVVTGGTPAAESALADAGLDAALRAHGVSLRSRLGSTRPRLARCEVIAAVGGSTEVVVARAVRAVELGAAMVKLKIVPGDDERVVAATAEALGARLVAVDCNGSYDDPRQLAAVDRLGLRYIEQPFGPSLGWERLAAAHRSLDSPVALDESLRSLGDVARAVDAGAVDVVSVKPARLGGVLEAARAVDAAFDAGVDAFVGGMLELGIGRSGAAAVASLPGCTLPTDLGPSGQYVETDICPPLVTDDDGWLVPPDGPGVGRVPDEHLLERFAVDEAEFAADL